MQGPFWKCNILGPTLGLLTLNLHFNKISWVIHEQIKVWEALLKSQEHYADCLQSSSPLDLLVSLLLTGDSRCCFQTGFRRVFFFHSHTCTPLRGQFRQLVMEAHENVSPLTCPPSLRSVSFLVSRSRSVSLPSSTRWRLHHIVYSSVPGGELDSLYRIHLESC